MRRTTFALSLTLSLVGLACGEDDSSSRVDARRPADAASGADARPADAMPSPPDAMVASTVTVTPNCTGIPAGQIDLELTTSGLAFSPAGPHSLPVGSIIRFQTNGPHNFASAAGTDARFAFISGAVGPHTACLTFTAATGSAVNFRCQQHASMTGTLTIAP